MPHIDWQGLFTDPSVAVAVSVEGVRLGDPVDALPFARLTAVEPRVERAQRVWRGSEAFDVASDGKETPVGHAQLEAELRQEGGSAWVDSIGFDVDGGSVRKIWIRGADQLDGIPVAEEGDIARLLGAPTGIERVLGWRVHHYAERRLSVGWDPKRARVEHVALGPVDWTLPVFDRAEVLAHWIEAARVLPSWDEPAERASSAWVRWARATALLRAFELGAPEAFARGRFLDGKPLDRYPRAAAAIAAHDRGARERNLAYMFWWLLLYRTNADSVLRYGAGLLEAGVPGLLGAIDLTDGASRAFGAALEPIEAVLFELISPDDRTFTEPELVARFGWPDVDLQALLDEEEGD